MNTPRFAALAASLALTTVLVAGCKKDSDPVVTAQTGTFSVELENSVGALPLNLDTDTYTTAAGDRFTVSTFRYYLSNLKLTKADGGSYVVPDSYFLVDQAKAASQHLEFKNVPVGDYTGLTFTVGVDSARTKAGNFAGVLDSNNSMWWDWSKEFINVKLEGRSPQSPSGGLVFHIAGFRGANGANNTIRTVSPAFPANAKLLIRADHAPEIHLHADVLGMFAGPSPVRFATTYNTMSATPVNGLNSVQIANNIAAGMFEVEHIHAN